MGYVGGLRFWLVGYFLGDTFFNFSDFDWEVYGVGFTIQVLVLLLLIGKVG